MVPYGPVWSRVVPYGSLCSHIDPYAPVWSHLALYCSVCSCMVPYGSACLVWPNMFLYSSNRLSGPHLFPLATYLCLCSTHATSAQILLSMVTWYHPNKSTINKFGQRQSQTPFSSAFWVHKRVLSKKFWV